MWQPCSIENNIRTITSSLEHLSTLLVAYTLTEEQRRDTAALLERGTVVRRVLAMDFCIFTIIFPKVLMGMWDGVRHDCLNRWSYPDCESVVPSKWMIDGNECDLLQGLKFGTLLVSFCQATALGEVHFHSSS